MAIREAFRVLKKGGRIMILEFSHVPNSLISQVYDQFSFQIIPKIGKMVANDEASYQYLVESIRRFPKQVCSISISFCLPLDNNSSIVGRITKDVIE